eukprot:COSAG01_NODE_4410_length_5051_cov_37.670840_3_plen_95_part_00
MAMLTFYGACYQSNLLYMPVHFLIENSFCNRGILIQRYNLRNRLLCHACTQCDYSTCGRAAYQIKHMTNRTFASAFNLLDNQGRNQPFDSSTVN